MQPTLSELIKYFLRLGATGFGGPIALCAQMKVELVDKRKWFLLEEYEEGFAFSQTAPGPVAFQLAMYLAFIRFRVLGATLAGIAFIATPFVLVLILSVLYVRYGTLRWIQAVLYGVSPAVVALVVHATFKLGQSMLRAWTGIFLAALSFAITVVLKPDPSLVIVGAGIGGLLFAARPWGLLACSIPALWLSLVQQAAPSSGQTAPSIAKLMWLFFKAGALAFGSGYVVIAFVQKGVVDEYQWLTSRQFFDGIAIGQVTPGPVIITSTFVGYLVAGFPGAIAATVSVLLPVYLINIFGAPLVRKFRGNRLTQGFISSATAASLGVIASVALQMTRGAVTDWMSGAILLGSLGALVLWEIPSVIVVVAAGCLGALLFPS